MLGDLPDTVQKCLDDRRRILSFPDNGILDQSGRINEWPITYAPRVQCPLLLCVGDRDTADSPQAALKTAQAAPYGEVRRYDCDHYDFYAGEIFERAVADQCTFLVRHLFAGKLSQKEQLNPL